MPSVGPYWSARADASAATRAMSAATSSAGNVARVGQPAGERDDLRPRGDGHQVAHGGGLHALRAAREQPGVALEVARGGPRPAHTGGFAAGARAPWRLVYRHAASGTYRAWTSSSTSSRAPDWRPRSGSGRSCRCCSPARSRRPTSGSTSAGPTSRSSRSGRSCSACWSSSSALDFAGRRAGRDAADRPPLLYVVRCAVALVLGALRRRRLGRRSLERLVGRRGRRRRLRGARLPGRALAVRPRAPRLDEQAANALPVYAEGAALAAAGLSILFPPLAIARHRRARLAARRRTPAGRREVRRPAHPALSAVAGRKKLVLAVIDAMKPAMLEKAVASGRAPALALLMERGHHSASAWRRSRRSRRSARRRSPPARRRIAT